FTFLQSLGTEIGKLSPTHATGEPDLGNRKLACLFSSVAVVLEGIDCSSSVSLRIGGKQFELGGSDFQFLVSQAKNVFIHEKWQLKPKNFAFLGGGPKAACAGCAGFAAFSVVIEKFLDRHE
ncbi:hypothetical protein HN873_051096, partial [Arachis hypogaea]